MRGCARRLATWSWPRWLASSSTSGQGWSALLADGDTGWHIRTGDWILQNRSVPTTDLFTFTRAGEPWFAWEWLSDVLMSLVHQHWGLAGVAVLAGCVILLSVMVLFRHMLWRGANVVVAFGVLLLAVGASSIHYLARPHVFTLLLMAVSLWMVERDRRRAGPFIWLLVPLSAVWINLHGGFFALPLSLAALAAGFGVEAWLDRPQRAVKWAASRRYAALAAATSAASILNPYGIKLHLHVARYLTSDWIRNAIQEFQSPSFRSESLLRFEVLLFAALLLGRLAAVAKAGGRCGVGAAVGTHGAGIGPPCSHFCHRRRPAGGGRGQPAVGRLGEPGLSPLGVANRMDAGIAIWAPASGASVCGPLRWPAPCGF